MHDEGMDQADLKNRLPLLLGTGSSCKLACMLPNNSLASNALVTTKPLPH